MDRFQEEKTPEDSGDDLWQKVKVSRKMVQKMQSTHHLTETELDTALNTFFNEDQSTGKTYTRILIERFFSKYSWYFPARNRKNPPSLSKAYAYFEHITLPRRLAGDQTAKHILRRSDPGETEIPTELYGVCATSSRSFIEWGIGMDQYFITLRIMAVVLFLAGLIHLPLLMYYRSDEYSTSDKSALFFSLQGSAVCATTEWVACTDCSEKWSAREDKSRIGTALNPQSNGEVVSLVERFACNGGQLSQGLINWCCFFFLAGAMWLLHVYLSAREVRFDEDKISSSDYTVVVQNPPKDATDPSEWRDFFSQFASKQVTAITIALNNDKLLRKLIRRRQYRNNLQLILPKGTDMNDEDTLHLAVAQLVRDREYESKGCVDKFLECTILPILRKLDMFLPPETLLDKSLRLTDEVEELLKGKYDVAKVFVTFETEEGQRAALTALASGRLDSMMHNTSNYPPGVLFRDEILAVTETAEANAIRWLDLGASESKMLLMRTITLGLSCIILGISGGIVASVRFKFGSKWAAPVVSVFNFLIPEIVKQVLMIFERHYTEGSYQASLYTKITLFRWVNTALLAKMITPWTSTLGSENKNIIPTINSVMWNELWLTPALQVLDLWGNFQKHYLAPRARTQDQMNMNFQGTRCNLGERYTALTNALFLCFFYSAVFPSSFFFGTAIITTQYFADKFCLMRVWTNNAEIGSEVARFSRKYFFSGALLAYSIISAYNWAGFPYDNLCQAEDSSRTGASQTYTNVKLLNGTMVSSVSVENDEFFHFCQQNWRGFDGIAFPPTERIQSAANVWLGKSQTRLVNLYGWTSVGALSIFIAARFGLAIVNFLLSWVKGVYQPRGQEQHIDFSSDDDIAGYVPQIKVSGFFFPFIACDINGIHKSLLGWTDRGHPFDYHNMIFDVPWDGMPRRDENGDNTRVQSSATSARPVFSTITHYPPDWMKDLDAH